MLGIIGGSGLYGFENFKLKEKVSLNTPFGKPSSDVAILECEGVELAFISRHGEEHSYPPHLVPYRANLWALREVGVNRVLAVSAVGAINRTLRPGDYVLVDGFIEFTKRREFTYYEGRLSKKVEGDDKVAELINSGAVVHLDMTTPYCPQMKGAMAAVMEGMGCRYFSAGIYACTEGPRFETPAEIKMLETLGADVVGMTGYPEVALARELTMCYVSLCVVANPAAGISGYRLTSDEVIELMGKKTEEIGKIIAKFVEALPSERGCECGNVLEGAKVGK